MKKTSTSSTAETTIFNDCESYFHTIYYKALDLIVNSVKQRFNQPAGFAILRNLPDA